MNPTQLLAHFDRISEAPDAVARLRRFILDLAVRGKLVEQDPSDEPAAELLKRIQAEKTRLVKVGAIRKQEQLSEVNASDELFKIPASWCWVRLSHVLTKLTDGTHHSPPNEPEGEFMYVTAKNIKPEGISVTNITYVSAEVHSEIYGRCNPEKGDILYIKDGATTGVVTINNLDQPFSMLSSVALLKLSTCLNNRLVVEFLRSPFFYGQMRGFMKGAAIPRVTLKRMAPAHIPLPPLAEQHRIVAKVDELMALCDELAAAQIEREVRRDQLVAASLNRIGTAPAAAAETVTENQTATSLHDAARFHLNHLPRLTTRPEHIKQLRQTILNLAVRGRLVVQDRGDEPAAELLKQIQIGIKLYGQQNRVKPAVTETIGNKTMYFPQPEGWMWARLTELCKVITDGDHLPPPKAEVGVAFLTIGNISTGTLNFTNCRYVPQDYFNKIAAYRRPEAGDLLYTVVGATYGRPALVEKNTPFCVQRHIAILKPAREVLSKYLLVLLSSPLA